MSREHEIIDTDFSSKEAIDKNTHPDRRKPYKNAKGKNKKREAVWIKKSTLKYEKELKTLQIELLKLQNHIKDKGLKLLVLFEGRDAAGKGGTIKRITEHLNPRGARIVALSKPSDIETSQWYFQRYVQHLPSGGEIVLFDRSWYNRAMVEPVMGFCTTQQQEEFLDEVPAFEKMQINSGTILIKFYFSVGKKEQAKRFYERKNDPLKQYKISPVDELAQELWQDYTEAKYKMLQATDSSHAPWVIIRSNNKKEARINAIKYILQQIDYPGKIDASELKIDDDILISGSEELNLMHAAAEKKRALKENN